MTTELLKWLQSVGAGAVFTLYQYVQGIPTAGWWQVVIVAILVRLVGYAVSKLPAA